MNVSPKHQPAVAAKAQPGWASRRAFDSLLESLSTDDAARAAFVADPGKVLDSYGLEFDRAQIPKEPRLPSKETLAAARASIVNEGDPDPFNFFIIFPSKRG